MVRVKFKKGEQRKFLKLVLEKLNCPSLRELISRGFNVPYSTLKSYYSENRNFPKSFFDDLCSISRINKEDLNVVYLKNNFGQIIGGKKSKRKK